MDGDSANASDIESKEVIDDETEPEEGKHWGKMSSELFLWW